MEWPRYFTFAMLHTMISVSDAETVEKVSKIRIRPIFVLVVGFENAGKI